MGRTAEPGRGCKRRECCWEQGFFQVDVSNLGLEVSSLATPLDDYCWNDAAVTTIYPMISNTLEIDRVPPQSLATDGLRARRPITFVE